MFFFGLCIKYFFTCIILGKEEKETFFRIPWMEGSGGLWSMGSQRVTSERLTLNLLQHRKARNWASVLVSRKRMGLSWPHRQFEAFWDQDLLGH